MIVEVRERGSPLSGGNLSVSRGRRASRGLRRQASGPASPTTGPRRGPLTWTDGWRSTSSY